MRFLGTLAAHVPPGDKACAAALEVLVAHLADQLQALDKVVRFRACQALALVLGGLPETEGVSEELAEGLTDGLLERLQDKAPLVRAQAARALARLPAPDEVRRSSSLHAGQQLFAWRHNTEAAWLSRRYSQCASDAAQSCCPSCCWFVCHLLSVLLLACDAAFHVGVRFACHCCQPATCRSMDAMRATQWWWPFRSCC